MRIVVDVTGVVGASCELGDIWFFPGPYPRPGTSLLTLLQPDDRSTFVRNLEQAAHGMTSFFPVRVLDRDGHPHPMHVGLRAGSAGERLLILQPLIDCAPIVGRRRGTRDPLTGLIDRWEAWRQMEQEPVTDGSCTVVFAKLDAFETVASSLTFQQVDEVFDRVASAIMQVFPWPAAPSRLTGGSFLIRVRNLSTRRIEARAKRLIQLVNRIGEPGVPDVPCFGLSVGIARASEGDADLALRLAETAVSEAHAAGGNRAIVAGPVTLIRSRVGDLEANMGLEAWDLWLQPVARHADGPTAFHEALARFGGDVLPRVSRPEFFTTGELDGLLARFDRLVWIRALELLAAHPQLRLSVNATRESFRLESFPDQLLDLLREANCDGHRLILEVSPLCLNMPSDEVRRRLDRLIAAGIEVAIDDFGSGVCSLRHLTDYPVAIVKLDALVTQYVADDPLQRNFVRMVVNLCRARGIRTVAEYTRTPEQMERLVEDGVDLFQGELLGMPMPATDALALLSEQIPRA
jgi:EAL domain-containing protein (putative c-di-GMP-specific phosphodiesterase class I)/GGDEF domain-containing protein